MNLVYTWRGRCFPCHWSSLDIGPAEAPRWITSAGDCGPASLATMNTVFTRELVDFDDPTQSLLLLKPLAVAAGGVMHGGHDKFADTEDETYRDFLEWIDYEVACGR